MIAAPRAPEAIKPITDPQPKLSVANARAGKVSHNNKGDEKRDPDPIDTIND